MGPTGRLAWRRSATSCAAGGGGRRAASGIERVWGDGPAGARCVAEAGVRDAASCGRDASTPRRGYARPRRSLGRRSDLTHCRPFRRLSRGSVRPRADSGRRVGAGGRMWVGVQVGATRRRDRSPPGRRPATSTWMLSMSSARDGYRPLRGLPYVEAAHRGGDHRRQLRGPVGRGRADTPPSRR